MTTTPAVSSSAPTLGVSGLVSGINSSSIIDALIAASRSSTQVIQNQETLLSGRLDAVRSFSTKLLSAQLDLGSVRRATITNAYSVSSSQSVVSATANSQAVPGTYALTVIGTAQANQIATAGLASDQSAVGTGTITLQVGAGVAKTITISAGNSSLQGVAKAINDAGAGVTASVVNDGGANPYRMVLQATTTGQANAISFSAVDDNPADGIDLAALATGTTTVQAAADAQVQLGSGVGAITIYKPTNTVSDLIPGVTLNLSGATTGQALVTVGRDTSGLSKVIGTAFDSLNTAITYLNQNTGYDATTKTGGVLIGETNLRQAMNTVVRGLVGADSSLPSSLNTLSSIGITIDQQTGTFSVDQSTLDAKLAQDPDGVTRLFANTGVSTASGVQFSVLTDKTKAMAYSVNVTAPAARAQIAVNGDIVDDGAGNVVINGSNNSLNLLVNGRAITVTLPSQSYTRAQLASEVQTAINAQSINASDRVVAGLNGNALDLHSEQYGLVAKLQVVGGTLNGVLNLSSAQATGTDVVGTIGGVAATGNGQILAGAVGSDAEGLRLTVTAGAPTSGTVTVRKGLAQWAMEAVTNMTDSVNGSVTGTQNRLQATISDLDDQVKASDAALATRKARLQAQFLQMETLISKFKNQGSFITSQINAMSGTSSGSGGSGG